MPRTPSRLAPRSLASLLLATLLLALPGAAQQSGVAALLGGGSSLHEVDGEAALEAARGSFDLALRERLGLEEDERGSEAELPRARREELAEQARQAFAEDARRSLTELRGDGLLTADEVTRALSGLRERRLAEAAEVMRAEAGGFDPPPRREDFSGSLAYLRALARYTFLERNSWRRWLLLLGATVAGLALAGGVLKLSKWSLGSGGGRLRGALRASVATLNGPLYLLLSLGGLAFGLWRIWLPVELERPTQLVLEVLLWIALFWAAWRLTSPAAQRLGALATPSDERPNEQALEVVRKALRLGLLFLFAFVVVEVLIGTDLTAVVAGLGLAGLAVTLAAQDTLKNLFATFTIHTSEPFRLGDLVRFERWFGTIEEIGFRATRLRTLDGHLVTIPNSKLVGEPVENVQARPHIRRRFHLDLPYDTPRERVERAIELVREVIEQAGELDPDEEVQVHFDELGPHSLRLLVQYHYREGDYWAAKEKATEVDLALVERFREEGIEFAFPTRTVHLVGAEPTQEPEPAAEEREPES
jgi:MscS family membrane protein